MTYKHILVAVDTNEDLENIVSKGVNIAKNNEADICTVHIDMKLENYYISPLEFDAEKYDKTSRTHSKANLLDRLKRIGFPIKNSIICSGDIPVKIQEMIDRYEIDLLIIGHHHYGKLGQVFISTAAPLIETMPCDILLIKLTND
ncbi:universal stress protein [Vibrio salinus]|uniref:universal stress protein n=1 Tax=Vibrio salinus TaxID=2899784 RepID=UPI001E2D57D0|nr:universal stress protein [Vibrio salinus]MCE0495152.1 universal stress protein [Vibrio salinus]